MTIRMKKGNVNRLERLLDMEYMPGEIASELGVSASTVYRSYIPAGAPCRQDASGRLWIPGTAFAAWARQHLATNRRGKPREPMPDGCAYCLRCNQVIRMQSAVKRLQPRGVLQVTGCCPLCAGKVHRFVSIKGDNG